MIDIKIDDKLIKADPQKTIIEVAREHDIYIPTLCYDKELRSECTCRVCAVEVKGREGFVMACGTQIWEGMEVYTHTDPVLNARKEVLKLILSDHYADCIAPCQNACPAHIDVQSYIASIANGQYHEAVKIIKERLPMPLSIGRICPAFCEKECRRFIVENPISIRHLKRFAADADINDAWQWVPESQPANGKKVCIIGAGPSGLSCGYYLSYRGFAVDIYEASAQPGGWLRYGIPEFRLPKDILDKEIALMCAGGMQIHTNTKLGRDIQLEQLCRDYDAVYLAIGAQKAVDMPVPGNDLEGVFLGVNFLQGVATGQKYDLGPKVAIIGGGNTAIDCARTALRLGSDVTIIYRRTFKEMPADIFEIRAAEQEGVKFMTLSNPNKYEGTERLERIVVEIMELGEPDASGRQRPVGTGIHNTHEFSSVIAAISQIPEVDFLSQTEKHIDGTQLPLTKWKTAVADADTMYTQMGNVFAGGDFRRGPATAVEAIADGKAAADAIETYIVGTPLAASASEGMPLAASASEGMPLATSASVGTPFMVSARNNKPYIFDSKKEKVLSQINRRLYDHFEKKKRIFSKEIDIKKRLSTFTEVEEGYLPDEATTEANRCLECGCNAGEICDLRRLATDYHITPPEQIDKGNAHPLDLTCIHISIDHNKCIKCGKCVKICAEIAGKSVLTQAFRGFSTIITPEFGNMHRQTDCDYCGKCVIHCPTGAMTFIHSTIKMSPIRGDITIQNCGLCGLGCQVQVHALHGQVRKITVPEDPVDRGFNEQNICFTGLFDWQKWEHTDKRLTPVYRDDGQYRPVTTSEVIDILTKQLETYQNRYAFISADSSTEEILLWQNIAENKGFTCLSAPYALSDELLYDTIKNQNISLQDFAHTELVVVFGELNQVVRAYVNKAKRDYGTEIVYIQPDFHAVDLKKIVADRKTIFVVNELLPTKSNFLSAFDFAGQCKILLSSRYPNARGLHLHHIPIYDKSCIQNAIVIAYKYPHHNINSENCFTVVIDTHYRNIYDSDADLYIPTSTYLEMDATAINIFGDTVQYKNPKKSNLYYVLLNILYESGLIQPALAEPSLWNQKAKDFVAT